MTTPTESMHDDGEVRDTSAERAAVPSSDLFCMAIGIRIASKETERIAETLRPYPRGAMRKHAKYLQRLAADVEQGKMPNTK